MYLLVFLIPSRTSGVHNINYYNGKTFLWYHYQR
jgi:hypothetical protein